MDWLTMTKEILALVTAFVGLVGSGVGAFFAIKNYIKLKKEKSAKEIWASIQLAADTAMKEAEKSIKSGVDKKTMVMNTVKETLKSQGINIDSFIDQLSSYIDETISFVNGMTK